MVIEVGPPPVGPASGGESVFSRINQPSHLLACEAPDHLAHTAAGMADRRPPLKQVRGGTTREKLRGTGQREQWIVFVCQDGHGCLVVVAGWSGRPLRPSSISSPPPTGCWWSTRTAGFLHGFVSRGMGPQQAVGDGVSHQNPGGCMSESRPPKEIRCRRASTPSPETSAEGPQAPHHW